MYGGYRAGQTARTLSACTFALNVERSFASLYFLRINPPLCGHSTCVERRIFAVNINTGPGAFTLATCTPSLTTSTVPLLRKSRVFEPAVSTTSRPDASLRQTCKSSFLHIKPRHVRGTFSPTRTP